MNKQSRARKKILFIAEAVTLAHVARPLTLANSLDQVEYEIYFACADRFDFCFKDARFNRRFINSISSEHFLKALARGSPVYDTATLTSYVTEDLKLIEEIHPDLIVGDFRLSLSVSARVSHISYMAICNAYWSPYAKQKFPLPDLPLNRFVGLRLAKTLFDLVRPAAFAYHTLPLNRVRRRFGMPSLGLDLRRIYTDADHVLYADVPELIPTFELPPNHRYLGPIIWSPPGPLPSWWSDLPDNRPIIYTTLGSSGYTELLPTIIDAMADLPVTVLLATAGKPWTHSTPANVYVAEYLPGEEAAKKAHLVICNGGSPTCQQALAAGVPILGIPSNMDQFLNMEFIVRGKAGALLRKNQAAPSAIKQAVEALLSSKEAQQSSQQLARTFADYSAKTRFKSLVEAMLN